MKTLKTLCLGMVAAAMLLTGCNSMTNTGKGALIGGGIGAAIGTAVGAGAGTLIGNRMDKQKKELEKSLANADVETVQDQNGLAAIKVTFPGGILFPTNGTTLSASAQTELAQFAASLKQNPETNVQIFGFTDNTGGMEVNTRIANGRALSVDRFLVDSGIAPTRLSYQGIPMADYVASNDTPAGRAQNRRVEIYITANQQMIQQAEQGTLK